MGNAIDLLYDGNLGSEDKILNYELITRVLRMRHSLEEWIEQLPAHMRLIRQYLALLLITQGLSSALPFWRVNKDNGRLRLGSTLLTSTFLLS